MGPTNDGREECRKTTPTREVGGLLMVSGMITGMLPPPPGPFDLMLVLGGLSVVWPRSSDLVGGWARKHLPRAHRGCQVFIDRFTADLDRRYPGPCS